MRHLLQLSSHRRLICLIFDVIANLLGITPRGSSVTVEHMGSDLVHSLSMSSDPLALQLDMASSLFCITRDSVEFRVALLCCGFLFITLRMSNPTACFSLTIAMTISLTVMRWVVLKPWTLKSWKLSRRIMSNDGGDTGYTPGCKIA